MEPWSMTVHTAAAFFLLLYLGAQGSAASYSSLHDSLYITVYSLIYIGDVSIYL